MVDNPVVATWALFRGFNLHAGVRVGRHQRDRLERRGPRKGRYIARPPLALDRLTQRKDGKILLTLKRPWSDGTRALFFEPEAFVERLCALIWKPRVNTVHYHGIFASGSSWRAEVVPDGIARQKRARLRRAQGKRLGVNERWIPWMSMLSHVFGHDEGCPACEAKRWVFDVVLGPWRVRRELMALGIDRSPREFAPARGPPSLW
ncbi:MAG: transposase [Myxococcota bacterium]